MQKEQEQKWTPFVRNINDKIESILQRPIFLLLESDYKEGKDKYRLIPINELVDMTDEKSLQLVCLQLASGNMKDADVFYNEYDIIDIYEKLSLKLSYEYQPLPEVKDGE